MHVSKDHQAVNDIQNFYWLFHQLVSSIQEVITCRLLGMLVSKQLSMLSGFVSSHLKLKGSSSCWWRAWGEAKLSGSDPMSIVYTGRSGASWAWRLGGHPPALALILLFSISLHRLIHAHNQMGTVDTGLEGMTNDQGS